MTRTILEDYSYVSRSLGVGRGGVHELNNIRDIGLLGLWLYSIVINHGAVYIVSIITILDGFSAREMFTREKRGEL